MAHTISKQIYSENLKKYVECEVLIFDEDEGLPDTDRREIILSCLEGGEAFSEIADENVADISDLFPETELIDQYESFDAKEKLKEIDKDFWK